MARTFAGARAEIFADGAKGKVKVGFATGISGSESIQLQRIDVLGNIDSEEIEPVGRTVSFSCDFVRMLDSSLQEQGIFPRGNTEEVITFEELTFEVYDNISDKVRWTIEGAKSESRSGRVDRSGVMTGSVSYQARKLHDEAGPI